MYVFYIFFPLFTCSTKMNKIAEQFQEYHARWKRIEKISQLSLFISQQSSSSSNSLSGLSTHDTSSNGFIEYTTKRSNNFRTERDPTHSSSASLSYGSSSDVNGLLESTCMSLNGTMEAKLWHLGSSIDALEKIEEEGSGAGSENAKPKSTEFSQVVEPIESNSTISNVEDVVGSSGSLTGSESEMDKQTYQNLVKKSSAELPKKRSRLNGLKKSFKLK